MPLPDRPKRVPVVFKRPLPPGKLWALAAGGILTELNGDPFGSISLGYDSQVSRHTLAEWWEVTNRRSLLERLAWLREQGHRQSLAESMREAEELMASHQEGETVEVSKQLEITITNLETLKRTGFEAWDGSRLVNVARWGLSAGYLNEPEAWKWILAAALSMRQKLTSWKDAGDDFVIGYRFWSSDTDPHSSVVQAYDRLLSGEDSPWQKLAWDIPLDELAEPSPAKDPFPGSVAKFRPLG